MKPRYTVGALLGIVLYLLSLGPVQLLYTKHILDISGPTAKVVYVFYYPTRFLAAFPPLWNVYVKYVSAVSGEPED